MQANQAHWNVRGPSFIALHKLFDDVYEHAGEWTDSIAERITALGGQAHGTLQAAAENTRLLPYPLDLVDERGHVERLSAAVATFGENVRGLIDTFTKLDDLGSADLCTEISRGVDKDLWFVEAHLGEGR
jgi:starvation-inducible DNA-binding protein